MGVLLARMRHRWVPMVAASTLLAGTCLTALATPAASSGPAARAVAANGEWPGVGKVCEPGPGGASSVRGVGQKSIDIAVFNDQSNTILPGLEKEFVQFAGAFAAWCNASGGINGRHIVVHSRDAALFNSAQVTNEACQSDFMAVGGGVVFDGPTVPVRTACGLGQITGYTPSDAGSTAPLQVNPNGTNPATVPAGWFTTLAKKYPRAVKKASLGAQNNPNVLEPEHKYEDAAQALGWKVLDFQTVPLSVADWTPYIQDLQTKGIEAVWPSPDGTVTSYLQAMSTAGYDPAFIILGVQFYARSTIQALAGLHLPPVYVETAWWPFELASQNPSTEQLVRVMHTYAKGDTVDFDDEEAAESWLLWAKAATACGTDLNVSCVLDHAASQKNWSAGGIQAPVAQLAMSNQDPKPSPCFAVLRATPRGFVYDKGITQPTQSIWNCNPKNVVQLTPQQVAALGG